MIRLKKVVDITELPQNLVKTLREYYSPCSNDSYFDICCYKGESPEDFISWLLDNGVVEGEEILLLYWW